MLDNRLKAVADFVPAGAKVADIGTDHAYLAMYLYQQDQSRQVIAGDKNAGPCEAARKTLGEADLQEIISVRQGDGLAVVQPREADTVCIAGMGGKLIADILEAGPEVLAGLKYAILQPQNAFAELRGWLYDHDWHIAKESLAKSEGRIYQILLAVPGKAPKPDDMELLLGPVLMAERPKLFSEHVANNIAMVQRVLQGLQKSRQDVAGKKQVLEEQIARLKELL